MNKLLESVNSTKWAILPNNLDAIIAIVNDHNLTFERSTFHQSENELQANIGTVGERMEGTKFISYSGTTAILHIDGAIIPRAVNTPSAGTSPNLHSFSNELNMLATMPTISNVVLAIDSGGGAVTGVSEFGELLANYPKPIVSFVYGYGASAAYWIASQTNKIYMAKTAEVGSIGTVATWYDTSKAAEKQGFTKHEIVSNYSPNKRLDATEGEGKEDLLAILDNLTMLFVEDVAKGRKTTAQNVLDTFGQGKMFLAKQAVELGMADKITTLDALVKDLNKENVNTNITGINTMNKKLENNEKELSFTAEDVKADAAIYGSLKKEIIAAEHERLQGIEALTVKDKTVASLVNKHKYDASATKESLALMIFENREDINATAAKNIVANGKALETATKELNAVDETTAVNKATASRFDLAAVKAEADKLRKRN